MNNEPQDIEELLNAIKDQVEPSEKPIVELYLKNPDALSPEYREKAAGVLKQFLSKYPEFAAVQNAASAKPSQITAQLNGYKQEMLELKEKYALWYDSIEYDLTHGLLNDDYKRCCQETKEAYKLAIKQEIVCLELKIKEITALEADPIGAAKNISAYSTNAEMFYLDKFCPGITEKKERLELWQKRYRSNQFFKAGVLGSFLHVGYSHRLPTDPKSWMD